MTEVPPPLDRRSARARIEEQAIAEFESKPKDTGIRRTGRAYHERPHELAPTDRWMVVVPVKGAPGAKSRLGASPELAMAIALDTVEAAASAEGVSAVVVVTTSEAAPAFDAVDAFIEIQDEPGLALAIGTGLEICATFAAPGLGTAVLLGDLPALQPGELAAALAVAAQHPRAMVPDADGSGTTLVTAADGVAHATAFGPASADAHRAAGYTEIAVDPDSGLRRDVDTAEDLAALAAAGRLGPRTAALASGA